MTDTSKVQRNALGLDGLYIEFQPEMLQPEGKARLQKLTAAVGAVGVWGRAVAAATRTRTPTLTLIRTLTRTLTLTLSLTLTLTRTPTRTRTPTLTRTRSPSPAPTPTLTRTLNPSPSPSPEQVAADGGPGDPDDLATLQQLVRARDRV